MEARLNNLFEDGCQLSLPFQCLCRIILGGIAFRRHLLTGSTSRRCHVGLKGKDSAKTRKRENPWIHLTPMAFIVTLSKCMVHDLWQSSWTSNVVLVRIFYTRRLILEFNKLLPRQSFMDRLSSSALTGSAVMVKPARPMRERRTSEWESLISSVKTQRTTILLISNHFHDRTVFKSSRVRMYRNLRIFVLV